MRVLVIEDEVELADDIARGLRLHGWAVDVAYNGVDGLNKAETNTYDAVLLDRDLPGMHGDDVCSALGGRCRVLMLTAAHSVDDRVAGLDLGADDYLGKPFAFAELVARLNALSRRPRSQGPAVLERAGIVVDPGRRSVTRDGQVLTLTAKEFAVLRLLLEAQGRLVTAEELLDRAWDEHADPFTNAVRITIATLRRKLGTPSPIETIVRGGYRIP